VGLGRGPCDLALILRLLVEDARRRPDADIRFDDGDHETLQIAADADAVAILLRNLIENAQDHGTGQVRVTLLADGRVTVENPTDGTEFLDEPFRKGAGSRGMGLGLSIVASLAGTMGAGMERRIGNGTARVTVRFPRA
jgi:two-component system OmpR family sensor kinase